MNKQQYQDLKALLVISTSVKAILSQAQAILSLDVRNPSDAAKLLATLKLGEATLTHEGNIAVVTVAESTGRSEDVSVALLRAVVAAIENKALEALLGEPKKKNPENTKTPERGSIMMQGRR